MLHHRGAHPFYSQNCSYHPTYSQFSLLMQISTHVRQWKESRIGPEEMYAFGLLELYVHFKWAFNSLKTCRLCGSSNFRFSLPVIMRHLCTFTPITCSTSILSTFKWNKSKQRNKVLWGTFTVAETCLKWPFANVSSMLYTAAHVQFLKQHPPLHVRN